MGRVAWIVLLCLASCAGTQAQKKPAAPVSTLCNRDYAVDTAKQQVLQSRTFDNVVQRIAVLVRAAELLWVPDQDQALAAFTEALDLAVQDFKQHGEQVQRTSTSRVAAAIAVPDQRFKVLTALAKYDPERARKLAEQMLDAPRDVPDKLQGPEDVKSRPGDKLLQIADGLVNTDVTSAVNFARASFKYPASLMTSFFCYRLARVNRQAADRFYTDALVAYSRSPMDQFLYLAAYPFGNTRDVGEMQSSTSYPVPEDFQPNRALQNAFMRVLLSRAERALAMPVDSVPEFRYPDHAQMWFAMTRLEKQVQTSLPDLAETTTRTKDKLFAMLNPTMQRDVDGTIVTENAPRKSFDDQVAWAEKQTNPGHRDQLLTSTITSSAKDQPVDKVLGVISKISDPAVSEPLVGWFYYFRTQDLIGKKEFIEARNSAAKVPALDQRAYLYTRIAEESLKADEDATVARELLDEVAQATRKAPPTIVSARAQLALAYLYAKVDTNRGIEELGNAVKTINALEAPDFSRQFVLMKIEGKTFGSYFFFSTPGFNPENAFREMGKLDFDGSLAQATTFSDKSVRALTTLAVIEPCFSHRPTRIKTRI